MRKLLLLSFLLFSGLVSEAQILLNQGFNVSTVTTTPPAGWTATGSATNTGCSVNGTTWVQVPSGGFNCTVNGTPSPRPTAQSGTGMAGFNSWDIAYGGVSDLVSPSLNFSGLGNITLSFYIFNSAFFYAHDAIEVYINTSATSTGATLIQAFDPTYNASPTGWVQYTYTLPASFNGPTNYIIFKGISQYGYDLFFDEVLVKTQTPPPPTPVTNNSPVCPGGTVTITATAPAGYPSPTFNLTGPGISMTNTTGIFNITNISSANAGTYSVTVASGGFTSTAATTTVSLYSTPTISAPPATVTGTTTCTACDGSFVINGLAASTAYSLSYTLGTTNTTVPITSSAAGTYTVSNLCAGTYTNIKVTTAAPQSCSSNSISVTIAPPSAPAAPTVTYQQPLCSGTTLQLTATVTPNPGPTATYTWSTNTTAPWTPSPGNGSTATRGNMTSALNGNYCATVTVNGCVSLQGCVAVTVNPKDPKPGVISPISYCQFEVSLPLAATGTNLTWYGPFKATSLAQDPCLPCPDSSKIPRNSITPRTDIATTSSQAFVYGVVQNQTCPSDTAYLLVQVKPKPPKPTVPPGGVDLCQFSPASPLSASGANIRWFSTPTGGTGTATAPIPSTLVSGTFFYYASQTVNGCESDRAVVTVNVKPKPAPPKVTSPLNLCQGDPVGPLTAIGQNLLWYNAAAGGVGVNVAPIPNTGYEDSFKYWVTQTVNGCESDRALIQAYVNYKPNGIIVGSSPWVCQDENDTFYYYGNGRADAQYVWSTPIKVSHPVSGGDTRGPFIVHFDSAGTVVVKLQINNKGCISTLIAAPITVRHLPVIDYTLKRDVCRDELVNIALTETEPNITNYAFSFGSTDTTMVYSAPPGGPFGIRYHVPGEYIVGATATLNLCTSKPLTKRITVHDLPDATITAAVDLSKPVCVSDTITLTVHAVPEGATYTWSPAAYFQSKEDTLNYIVRAVVSQSSVVKVNVKTAYGCEATDSIDITTKPCCGMYFPTAFAPEGNIIQNRTFKPITVGFNKINSFRVINRWGQVVYETRDMSHNPTSGWDGNYNGVKQDMGVYYWYISYKCEGKNVEEHGEVTLLR